MPADSLHVSQMKGFVPPEVDPPANTVFTMQAAADAKAARTAKKAEAEPTEQSSPDAAPAE